jgi:hypothetical protein
VKQNRRLCSTLRDENLNIAARSQGVKAFKVTHYY